MTNAAPKPPLFTIFVAHFPIGINSGINGSTRSQSLSALTGTKVLFVGYSKAWNSIKADTRCRAKVEKIFAADWAALVKWLHVLKAINPLYKDVEILEEPTQEFLDHDHKSK